MKILFCSQTDLSKELGASKVVIELAEEMERVGWQCTLVSPRDVAPSLNGHGDYSVYLRRYLLENAVKYDVVEYDHHYLPYRRSDFPAETLFVARSVLLAHHFNKISIPRSRGLKSAIRTLTIERNRETNERHRRGLAQLTLCEADLVNVANLDDKAELVRNGIAEEKIAVIPYGISRDRRCLFDSVSSVPPQEPRVAFVGTFDMRKGAGDLPQIFTEISLAVPETSFSLLGTMQERVSLLAAFPKDLRDRIEVVPRYAPDDLPELLASCSVGVFPSYIEGFGFGVLEMMAASVPVIAYNAPGPPMMLTPKYLVARSDTIALSAKVIALLRDRDELARARVWAKARSHQFSWSTIAEETSRIYIDHLRRTREAQHVTEWDGARIGN